MVPSIGQEREIWGRSSSSPSSWQAERDPGEIVVVIVAWPSSSLISSQLAIVNDVDVETVKVITVNVKVVELIIDVEAVVVINVEATVVIVHEAMNKKEEDRELSMNCERENENDNENERENKNERRCTVRENERREVREGARFYFGFYIGARVGSV